MEELGFRSSLVKGDRLSTRTELTHNSSACPTELTGACGNAGRAPGSIGFVVTEDFDGLADRRKSVVSPKRVPLDVCEQVLGLYRERYYDLNIRHFQEKLQEEHGIELSYTWAVQRSWQSFLRDSEGRGAGRQASFNAGRESVERLGRADEFRRTHAAAPLQPDRTADAGSPGSFAPVFAWTDAHRPRPCASGAPGGVSQSSSSFSS